MLVAGAAIAVVGSVNAQNPFGDLKNAMKDMQKGMDGNAAKPVAPVAQPVATSPITAEPAASAKTQPNSAKPESDSGGIDKEYLTRYGGLYSMDCKQPDILSAEVQKSTMTIFANARKLIVKNLETSVSSDATSKTIEIAVTGEVEKDVGATLEIHKDKKGRYGVLSGHPKFEKQLFNGAGKRMEYCTNTSKQISEQPSGSSNPIGYIKAPKEDGASCSYILAADEKKKNAELVGFAVADLRINFNGSEIELANTSKKQGVFESNYKGYQFRIPAGKSSRCGPECVTERTTLEITQPPTNYKFSVPIIVKCES